MADLGGLRRQGVQESQKRPHGPAGGNHPAGEVGREDFLVLEATHGQDLLELEQVDGRMIAVVALVPPAVASPV
jgi:hypothetical protein